MRDDFDKIITERGRVKNYGRFTRGRVNNQFFKDLDSAPTHLSNREMYGWKEHTRINYQVFRKFLKSRLGRDWDAIQSEIAAVKRHNNQPFNEMLKWALENVISRTFMVNGEIHYTDHRVGGDVPVQDKVGWWHMRDEFYVHPETKKLCQVDAAAARKVREQKKQELEKTTSRVFRWIDERVAVAKICGVWYKFEFVEVKRRPVKAEVYNYTTKKYETKEIIRETPEECVYMNMLAQNNYKQAYRKEIPEYNFLPQNIWKKRAVTRSQLNKKEKKALGLAGL